MSETRPARQRRLPLESRVERKFNEWINTPDGRHVEAEVVRRAMLLRSRGLRHYGIAALVEAIRYDANVALQGDEEFRINNSYRSFLARRVMRGWPLLDGFFETRELRGL